jgi:hypothetical protein
VVNEFCVVGVFRGLIRHLTRPPATLSPVEAERVKHDWYGGLKNTWINRKELKEHIEQEFTGSSLCVLCVLCGE